MFSHIIVFSPENLDILITGLMDFHQNISGSGPKKFWSTETNKMGHDLGQQLTFSHFEVTFADITLPYICKFPYNISCISIYCNLHTSMILQMLTIALSQ